MQPTSQQWLVARIYKSFLQIYRKKSGKPILKQRDKKHQQNTASE